MDAINTFKRDINIFTDRLNTCDKTNEAIEKIGGNIEGALNGYIYELNHLKFLDITKLNISNCEGFNAIYKYHILPFLMPTEHIQCLSRRYFNKLRMMKNIINPKPDMMWRKIIMKSLENLNDILIKKIWLYKVSAIMTNNPKYIKYIVFIENGCKYEHTINLNIWKEKLNNSGVYLI